MGTDSLLSVNISSSATSLFSPPGNKFLCQQRNGRHNGSAPGKTVSYCNLIDPFLGPNQWGHITSNSLNYDSFLKGFDGLSLQIRPPPRLRAAQTILFFMAFSTLNFNSHAAKEFFHAVKNILSIVLHFVFFGISSEVSPLSVSHRLKMKRQPSAESASAAVASCPPLPVIHGNLFEQVGQFWRGKWKGILGDITNLKLFLEYY